MDVIAAMLDDAEGNSRCPLAGRLRDRQCNLEKKRLLLAQRRNRNQLTLEGSRGNHHLRPNAVSGISRKLSALDDRITEPSKTQT